MTTALVLGASGNVGTQVVRALDEHPGNLHVRLASNLESDAERWRSEGRDAFAFDLNDPTTFASALAGVDRVFMLTTYNAEMLFQGKTFIDAAADNGVSHIVHLGVFSSRRDLVPHYTWHDLLETYLAASGVAWTNLHPNNILNPGILGEDGTVATNYGNAQQGFIAPSDIGAVAAAVLREGPDAHAGKDYWLSAELLTGAEVASVLSDVLGTDITWTDNGPDGLAASIEAIPHAGTKLYLESAVRKMTLAASGDLPVELQVIDDVQTVLGRPALTVAQWATANLTTP